MLCIHACNVCPKLNVICSHFYTCFLLRWLVIGHPFELTTMCYLFFLVKKNKKQVYVHNLHWSTKIDLWVLIIWSYDGQGHEHDETQPSVFISVNCPLTCTKPTQLNIGMFIFATWFGTMLTLKVHCLHLTILFIIKIEIAFFDKLQRG
jgi:hypothetical protein